MKVYFTDINHIIDIYFSGNYIYLSLFVICLFTLVCVRKKISSMLATYVMSLLLIIVLNPLSYVAFERLPASNEGVYSRLWLLVPCWVCVAFVLSEKISASDAYQRKVKILLSIVVLVGFGQTLYQQDYYIDSTNIYKVNDMSVRIVDTVKESGIENPSILYVHYLPEVYENYIVGGSVRSGIQQYSSDVYIYDFIINDEVWNEYIVSDYIDDINMTSEQWFVEAFTPYCDYGISFIIIPYDECIVSKMENAGFEFNTQIGDYLVFNV